MAYFGFVFWTLIYDTIYGFLDIEDDKKIGVKSFSRLLESRNYKLYFYYFGFIFIALCVITELALKPSKLILLNIIPALLIFYSIQSFDISNKKSFMKLFKFNSIIGLSMLLPLL